MSMTDKEKIDIFLQNAGEMGITLDALIEYKLAKDHSFLSMSSKIKLEYDRFFDKLLEEYKTTKEKGDVLESLASCLMFSEENVFNLKRNVRTSSNEIDLLVTLSNKGKMVVPKLYGFLGEKFLCECKNYGGALGVTYVGKFYSLLKVSNSKVGILFTIKGVTGTSNWKDSKAFIHKVALKEDIAILVFELNDYRRIKEDNVLFLDLVEEKYQSLMTDISYDQYISSHEAEERLFN